MRKRSKRLSGLPSEHNARIPKHTGKIFAEVSAADKALQARRCDRAFEHLSNAEFSRGALSVDAADSGRSYTVRAMREDFDLGFHDIMKQFRAECLRKPGLLDRFRKKRS